MKRILCFVFVAVFLMATFSVAAGAEITTITPVMKELATLYVDGKQFSEADYPADASDKNLYVIAMLENGFVSTSYSPTYELFLYIYNPSCITFGDFASNSIQIGLNYDCKEYNFFGLDIVSRSTDQRFLKVKVAYSNIYGSNAPCYKDQQYEDERVYNIVNIRFYTNGKLESYTIDLAYVFKGFKHNDTLTCSTKELGTLDVELHTTNWISPNAGIRVDGRTASIYDHYEINTVYFSIPKEVYYQYEYLKSIRAVYDALRLTPIVVTRPDDLDDVTKNAIIKGSDIALGGSLDVMDLVAEGAWYTTAKGPQWGYSESEHVYDMVVNSWGGDWYNSLAYYFENLPTDFDYNGDQVIKAAVNSEDLEAYFYERYNDPKYDDSKLYSEIRSALTIDYNSRDFDDKAFYNLRDYSSALDDINALSEWITKLCLKKDSYVFADFADTVDHIKVIENPAAYSNVSSANYESVSEELIIGMNDVADFADFCAKADLSNDVVVLLRFGFSDYRCMVLHDAWETVGVGNGPDVAVGIEKWAYMNLNIAHLVFYNDGADIVVPVASNTVDSFGDLDVFPDPSKDFFPNGPDFSGVGDWLDLIVAILRLVLIIMAVVAVIVLVVWIYSKFKPTKFKFEFTHSKNKKE